MTPYVPTREEFKAGAREAFAFLVREFGCTELPVPAGNFNPVTVWFANAPTRIVVDGENARAAVGRAGPQEAFENNDLNDLVAVQCPDVEQPTGGERRKRKKDRDGQLEQLPKMAALLRRCGADVLNGDFRSFAGIARRQQDRMDEWRKEAGVSPSAEHPAAISPFETIAICVSPDGRFRATVRWDREVPERDRAAACTLVITDTITAAECAHVDSCSSALMWSDDSRALAIPRWTRRAGQSLCVISPASRRMK